MRWTVLGILAVPLLLLGVCTVSAQTGMFFDEFGGSYKATAMGQAFTAVADDYSASYYNPAGLTQIKGIFENSVGYVYARPQVRARFLDNSLPSIDGQPSSRGLFAGIASSLDLEETIKVFPWFRRFAFGQVTWMNLPEINQYHAGPVSTRPHFLRHDMRFQLLALALSLGFEVTPWFSIGAGIMPSIDSVSDQDAFIAINYHQDEVMGLRLSIHQTAKVFAVPIFGILIKPPRKDLQDTCALGVSYRGENKAHHGKGVLQQHIGEEENGEPLPGGIAYPTVLTINLISFAPEQISVGISSKPLKGLTLAYDMTCKRWSQYETYLEQPPNPPFDDTFTHRFGVEYLIHPGFKSPVVRRVSRIALRGGYYFEPTPVTDVKEEDIAHGNAFDNIFDSDQDVFSLGTCVTVAGNTTEHNFELFFQYHYFHDRLRIAYVDPVLAYENGIETSTKYSPVKFGGEAWAIGGSYMIRF